VVLLRASRLRRDAVAKAEMLDFRCWILDFEWWIGGFDKAKDMCDHFTCNPSNAGWTSTGEGEKKSETGNLKPEHCMGGLAPRKMQSQASRRRTSKHLVLSIPEFLRH